jgi:hypothetical protein
VEEMIEPPLPSKMPPVPVLMLPPEAVEIPPAPTAGTPPVELAVLPVVPPVPLGEPLRFSLGMSGCGFRSQRAANRDATRNSARRDHLMA